MADLAGYARGPQRWARFGAETIAGHMIETAGVPLADSDATPD